MKKTLPVLLIALALSSRLVPAMHAQKATLAVQADAPGKPISPDLFGIFFEDINYAADGGLYAELIQNRSFEYQATEMPTWNSLTSWELVQRGGGKGSISIDVSDPIHPNNPHCAILEVGQPGEGVGLVNAGFDGIPVKAGESYEVALFARHLYTGSRWAPAPTGADAPPDGTPKPKSLIVRLESKDGQILSETPLEMPGKDWTRLTAAITPSRTDDAARFVILMNAKGGLALDVVSLSPKKTFRNRPNGLRADLAQAAADLQPKFMRFPGGCLVHGNGIGNLYRWKDTIGPIEQRKEQPNLWRYHQTVGLGYFEFFQFCEDIGAKPLPVVAAAVSCQNSSYTTGGTGQKGLPMEQMPAYIQEVLDLVEYANGPADSTWGAKRAAAGHPEPFRLEYLGIGNEDHITPVFKERFQMIYEAVKAKHPEITVIGTVGPAPKGPDFEAGWKIADELRVPMVDEHYYEQPAWFLQNLGRYDAYGRSKSKVYLGEYAAHDIKRQSTLRSALAEAAYMTGLERNGDVVRMASYAPLLAKRGHTQWSPDLIYFTNTAFVPTINYYVQQMFSRNAGDLYLPIQVNNPANAGFAASAVRESRSGDLILKLVNAGAAPESLRIELSGAKDLAANAITTVLSGDPMAVNSFETAQPLLPQTSTIAVEPAFDCEAPPNSLTVIRIPGHAPR
jgi:alpha-N-arabinofuranosidase